MVRVTRFSFDDGMNVHLPAPRDRIDDDDFDEVVDDDASRPSPSAPPSPRRNHPGDRRPDRRQIAGGDWQKPVRPDEPDDTLAEDCRSG